ncbi:GIY-YIG nuclease family protein [Lunatibacter salilacus]|uniref:GIY-YIG nuclease family protein n=1 Tax=Lunatibacter salilacus TaxID=2483804 RepID=UPI001F2089C1|nr:GIY-YIG nuclease family protein [Lunatibacter salilacus]
MARLVLQSGFFLVMEYFVYILYSETTDRYYVGQTQNLEESMERHNSGRNKSTKPGIPWTLVHFELSSDRLSAMAREKYIKNHGSKRYLTLISNSSDMDS